MPERGVTSPEPGRRDFRARGKLSAEESSPGLEEQIVSLRRTRRGVCAD